MKKSHCCLQNLILIASGALFMVTVPSGCIAVAAGAGAGAVAYIRGELNSSLEASVEKAAKATQAAITDLKLSEISSKADALSAEFVARDAQDNKIVIVLKRNTDHITSISIRVDTFGDQEISQTILESIKKHL
jgi:hypothetical protein